MSKLIMRALLGCASTLVVAQAAFATADQVSSVDEVIVTARRDPEEPPVVADVRARLSETPGAVAVISSESYANRYAPDLTGALRDAPGVYVQKKWGEDVRISIRGSGVGNNNHNRGLLLAQDGVPFNEADGFGDTQMADTLAARFIEVYKGGNALRFGGALLGGAVNIVTPTGRTAVAPNQLRLETGSFDTYRVHGEVARAYGDWDVFAAATGVDAEGYRIHSAQTSARGSLNIGRRFGEEREVRLYLAGGDIQQDIPGALTLAQALTAPTMAAAATLPAALDQGRHPQVFRGAVQTHWRFNDSLSLDGGVYTAWKHLDHPIFQVLDQQSRTYGAFARLDWTGAVRGRVADAFLGGWLRNGDLDNSRFINLQGNHGAPTALSFEAATAADLFAEGRLFVTDSTALVAGGAWTRATRKFRGAAPSPVQQVSKTYDGFSPRIGVLWQGQGGQQVFANLTRSIEPPNMSAFVQNNIPQPTLESQDAWTAEIGTRGRSGAFTWDATLYQAQIDGELLTFATGLPVSPPAATFNARGGTTHNGLEAALDWRFAQGWRLRQSYTWSDFRFDNEPAYGDNRLPIIPEHFYRAELRYETPNGWFIAPSLEWSGRAYVDYANTTKSPSYAAISLNGGYRINHRVRVYMDARNLTDKHYVSNVNAVIVANAATVAYWPGEGRAVFFGLAANF